MKSTAPNIPVYEQLIGCLVKINEMVTHPREDKHYSDSEVLEDVKVEVKQTLRRLNINPKNFQGR